MGMLTAAVPPGLKPGESFEMEVTAPQGFMLKVPPEVGAGDRFSFFDPEGIKRSCCAPDYLEGEDPHLVIYLTPACTNYEHRIIVPKDSKPGDEIIITSDDGTIMKVSIPEKAVPGCSATTTRPRFVSAH